MSFIRRYSQNPGITVLQQIEGVVIIDQAPPGSIAGTGIGTVCVVGEFQDMTYCTQFSNGSQVSANISMGVTHPLGTPQPQAVVSFQDILNKFGEFDATIGDFGNSEGNGFVAIKGKQYSSLVLVPVNLASIEGVRYYRHLPTNTSATVPTPVVPMQAAMVFAGRQFMSGSNRVLGSALRQFTALGQYTQGVDGATTATGLPAATQTFTSAGANFSTAHGGSAVLPGDIIVIGVISAAGAQGTDANTYRVQSVTNSTTLVLEQMDGSNFTSGNWITGSSLAYRLHPASDADTGGNHTYSDQHGYDVPARPLDVTIAAGTILPPLLVPAVETASTWDPLSSLHMLTQTSNASTNGITFTTSVQAPNAVSHANLDALYSTALASLLTSALPQRSVNIVDAARHSSSIASTVHSTVDVASQTGLGHMGVISPPLQSVLSSSAAIASTYPGVGANRDERVIYAWPGVQVFVPEAVGSSLTLANGMKTTTGVLDLGFDQWVTSVLSVLNPENNPGQNAQPVSGVFAAIQGYQTGLTLPLGINDYILLKQNGVAGLFIDPDTGPEIESGITTSLVAGQTTINRRRMADYIQDSLASALKPMAKQLLTTTLQDSIVTEVTAFLAGLQSANNPAAQRIAAFSVDDKSGNTPAQIALGIFVVIVQVQTLATADVIVLQVSASPQALTVTTQ